MCVSGRKTMRKPPVDFEGWFWSKVQKTPGCWLWMGTRHKEGYGMLRIPGHRPYKRAPRIAWELAYNRSPEGLMVRHSCDNPPCVRPDHLLLGTVVDNTQDKIDRGRALRGEAIGNSVLTGAQVLEIRSLYASGLFSQAELARAFNVSITPINLLLNYRTWRHI